MTVPSEVVDMLRKALGLSDDVGLIGCEFRFHRDEAATAKVELILNQGRMINFARAVMEAEWKQKAITMDRPILQECQEDEHTNAGG